MKIIFSASECSPIAKVGGLADVIGSLPKALKKIGVDVSVIIPFYRGVNISKKDAVLYKKKVPIKFNQRKDSFDIWKTYLPKSRVPLFLIEHKEYFAKKGVYVEKDASSGGSKKEAIRFLFLSAASIKVAQLIKADILNCHDWHTAITPFLVKKKGVKIKTLLTIHNLGYQGKYSHKIVNNLLGTDFSQKVNCLKSGIMNANFINTVSPTYAKEILTPKFGKNLARFLRKRKKSLTGILNGLDYDLFNPETDSFLKRQYSYNNLEAKKYNKVFLQKKCFKKVKPEIPVLGIISRLAEQKGIDLIERSFPTLMKKNIQFVLLGKGATKYENFFKKSARLYPKKCWSKITFNEELAHQIYGGIDMFLMPSEFEPCGLGQQIAMKYGSAPVARAVGGIKDTVIPVKIQQKGKVKGNGFLFKRSRKPEFLKSIREALDLYDKKNVWKQIQLNNMKKDFTWEKSAKKYKFLYKKIIKNK